MKKEQEIANKEFEIADRLIECDGEVKVKHRELGVCTVTDRSVGVNRSVVRDYKGDRYSVFTSDLTLVN